jgi:hypothetical protein
VADRGTAIASGGVNWNGTPMARAHARQKAPDRIQTPTVASAAPLIRADAWRYAALFVAIFLLLLAVYQPAPASICNATSSLSSPSSCLAQSWGS